MATSQTEVLRLYIKCQKDELRKLNEVISKRKDAYREQRDRLEEVKKLHVGEVWGDYKACRRCNHIWPCPTYDAACGGRDENRNSHSGVKVDE